MEQQRNTNEVEEIDLLQLFLAVLEHRKMVILSTILVALIALVYSALLVTPMYASTSELYVLSKSTSLTSLTDLQVGTNLTSDYMEVISGRPVLEQVIDNLGLKDDYVSLKERVVLENPTNSRIMKITVTDPNPKNAKAIADEIAEVSAAYISEKMDQDPPTIIQYGYADNDKVSPSIGKNTFIGAIIGFLLASAVVIVGYLLNDTITNPDDLEKNIGLHVLASLPLEESEYDGESSNKKRKRRSKKEKSA